MSKKILIIGILHKDGRYLSRLLLKKKNNVSGLSLEYDMSINSLDFNKKKIKILKIDLNQKQLIRKMIKKNFDEIYFFNEKNCNIKNSVKNQQNFEISLFILEEILKHIRNQKIKKTHFFYFPDKKKIKEKKSKSNFLIDLIIYQIIKTYKEMFSIPAHYLKSYKEVLKKL